MNDQVDGGMDSVLRRAANGARAQKFHLAIGLELELKIPSFLEKSRRPMIPNAMELTGLFSKLPPLRTLTPARSTTAALHRA